MNEVAEIYPIDGARIEPLENLDAEQALLGALLSENSLIPQAAAIVGADDFNVSFHGRLFAAIAAANGKPVNPVLLRPHFEADEDLKQLGGPTYP